MGYIFELLAQKNEGLSESHYVIPVEISVNQILRDSAAPEDTVANFVSP